MDFLDIYDKELDIFCEDAKNSINISFSSDMIAIYESGDIQSPSFIDKVDKAITKLIEKIKKLFHIFPNQTNIFVHIMIKNQIIKSNTFFKCIKHTNNI